MRSKRVNGKRWNVTIRPHDVRDDKSIEFNLKLPIIHVSMGIESMWCERIWVAIAIDHAVPCGAVPMCASMPKACPFHPVGLVLLSYKRLGVHRKAKRKWGLTGISIELPTLISAKKRNTSLLVRYAWSRISSLWCCVAQIFFWTLRSRLSCKSVNEMITGLRDAGYTTWVKDFRIKYRWGK